MSDRRRRLRAAVFLLAVLPANVLVLVMASSTATAGTQATTNACLSNATATYSDLSWSLSGTAAPNPASVGGGAITLSGGTVGVNIPATLLIAGYNLGLLTVGSNNIPTTVYVARSATNATPATQVNNFTITATTTISDPNGIPGSGDETATPLAVNQALPNMVVTPTGGNVAFAQAAPGAIGTVPLGTGGAPLAVKGSVFAQAAVAGGLIKANFDCSPGNTIISPPGGTSGPTFTPATSVTAFETVTVTGGSSTTSTSTSSTSSSTSTSSTSTSTTSPTTSTTMGTTTTLPGSTTVSGTETFVATCKNSVTPDSAELTFAITGTAPAKVNAGDAVTLSDQSWTVGVPASVLNTGLGLGLLNIGDTVAGTVIPSLFASNTEEGTRTLSPVAVQIGPIQDDGTNSQPPKAKPVSATFAVPDTSWTTVGGTVGYSLGAASVEVAIGPLKVKFSCEPNDLSLTVVETEVVGSTGVPPAGRPGDGTTTTSTTEADVAGTQVTTTTLPKTGSNMLMPVAAAVILLDLGYLFESAVRPARRRPDSWT